MDLNLNVNECFISGDAELMLKRSCGQECLVFQDVNNFRHSTPKEAASRFHGKHGSIVQNVLFTQSKSKENICAKNVKCTHNFIQRKSEEFIHSTPKFNNDLTNIRSERSKKVETFRESKEIKKPYQHVVLKTARVLHSTPKEFGNKLMTRCQAILKEGEFCHSTPKETEIQPRIKFAEKGKISHSTPKETDNIRIEDEDMLWNGASAKVLQRAMSAPQLPGKSEFDSNNLHRVMSLPHLWIPRNSTYQVQHWQRRLEVLNRKTEKMRQKDKALKERLEGIQKRADMLTRSPIPTPVKQPESGTSHLNKYFNRYSAKLNVPKIKKRVVHHPNNVYSCTLGNLIIGNSELHTYWKNGQRCTYV
ncbi:uncharacterized protein LOC133202350 [Saccostrea echinata]|uniref:uncharacterized protein LOC133202350 n=1 Tax=Saccostrea echinata TaxID=191078 RepID=UPI002A7F8020|nr:uncharacterized protein LOC133202350 [Saccostrea echinata]